MRVHEIPGTLLVELNDDVKAMVELVKLHDYGPAVSRGDLREGACTMPRPTELEPG